MSSLSDLTIGIVTWDSPPFVGGLGRAMYLLQKDLQAIGARTVLLSPDTHPLLAITRRFGGHVLMSILLFFVLPWWKRKHAVDLFILPVGPGGLFLFKKGSVKILALVYHTYEQQSRLVPGQRWKRFFLPLEKKSLKMADSVCTFTHDAKNVLEKAYGLHHVRLWSQSFNPHEWRGDREGREPDLCVCVSRLDVRKGIDVLMRAWPKVLEECPSARLIVVGCGGLSSRVDALRNADRRHGISESDVRELLGRASIAICPSYLEGFGFACAEALAAGTAVVASDCDGLRSLVKDEETGLLFPPGDDDALAESLSMLLNNPQRRAQLSLNAVQDMARRFSPSISREQLQAALLELCSSR